VKTRLYYLNVIRLSGVGPMLEKTIDLRETDDRKTITLRDISTACALQGWTLTSDDHVMLWSSGTDSDRDIRVGRYYWRYMMLHEAKMWAAFSKSRLYSIGLATTLNRIENALVGDK
jgi:hypothetical protein